MVLLYFWVIGSLFIAIGRWLILLLESTYYSKGLGGHRALIIGSGQLSQDIAERMLLYPRLGYFYVGTLDDAPPERIHFHLRDRFQLLGATEQFESICDDQKVSAIFLVKRDISQRLYTLINQFCIAQDIELNVLTEPVLNAPLNRFRNFDGIPVLTSLSFNDQRMGLAFKRALDIIVSVAGLLILSPLYLATICWIRIVSPNGPVFLSNTCGFYGSTLSDD